MKHREKIMLVGTINRKIGIGMVWEDSHNSHKTEGLKSYQYKQDSCMHHCGNHETLCYDGLAASLHEYKNKNSQVL